MIYWIIYAIFISFSLSHALQIHMHVETIVGEFFIVVNNTCLILYNRGKDDYQIDYVPAPRITEADKTNDRK